MTLLRQMYETDAQANTYPNEINNTVHTMAAHVHRYKVEMEILEEIASDLAKTSTNFCTAVACSSEYKKTAFKNHLVSLALVTSNIKALRKFVGELETKNQTVITLVRLIIKELCGFLQQHVPDSLFLFASYSTKFRRGTTSRLSGMGTQ